MTEQEWLACADPEKLLRSRKGRKVSKRKQRLFGCGCCRCMWHLIPDERSRAAVLVAEQFVDGEAGEMELENARREALKAYEQFLGDRRAFERCFAAGACWCVVAGNARDAARAWRSAVTAMQMVGGSWDSERAFQASLVRDIFGNPFRPVSIDPAWLAWNDGTVPKLAQAIYDERAFDRLPILADALEEAGCTDTDILSHCRGPGPHVRGCWVVDALLGKQ